MKDIRKPTIGPIDPDYIWIPNGTHLSRCDHIYKTLKLKVIKALSFVAMVSYIHLLHINSTEKCFIILFSQSNCHKVYLVGVVFNFSCNVQFYFPCLPLIFTPSVQINMKHLDFNTRFYRLLFYESTKKIK